MSSDGHVMSCPCRTMSCRVRLKENKSDRTQFQDKCQFREVAVIGTPMVDRFYKKKCHFRRVLGQQPHPFRAKWPTNWSAHSFNISRSSHAFC